MFKYVYILLYVYIRLYVFISVYLLLYICLFIYDIYIYIVLYMLILCVVSFLCHSKFRTSSRDRFIATKAAQLTKSESFQVVRTYFSFRSRTHRFKSPSSEQDFQNNNINSLHPISSDQFDTTYRLVSDCSLSWHPEQNYCFELPTWAPYRWKNIYQPTNIAKSSKDSLKMW